MQPDVARKYSTVKCRFSRFPIGLNQPVDSPMYETTELMARERTRSLKIRRSPSGAICSAKEATLQATTNSHSWLSQRLLLFEALPPYDEEPYWCSFMRRRWSAKNRRIMWNTTLNMPQAAPSLNTVLMFFSALKIFKRAKRMLIASLNSIEYLTILPAFKPRALKKRV